ncbi:hypothetical protein HHK36_005841 [Tetracentron sinense]|uniref:RRM domain-containing protein n=1 Tax=Tetracentron sinense TaxID=13715 RepID=A0A834ZW41_TETSI|nr:hypothetical protein HHK36_005841 [Tetracentron sinense]
MKLDALTNHFRKYGQTSDQMIVRDYYTKRSRGFGYLTFADPSVVDRVIQETHEINGKQVEIQKALPKKKKSKPPPAPAFGSDFRAHSFGDGFGDLGDSYSGFGGSRYGPAPYRSPGVIGSRIGGYNGYGGDGTELVCSYGGFGAGSGLVMEVHPMLEVDWVAMAEKAKAMRVMEVQAMLEVEVAMAEELKATGVMEVQATVEVEVAMAEEAKAIGVMEVQATLEVEMAMAEELKATGVIEVQATVEVEVAMAEEAKAMGVREVQAMVVVMILALEPVMVEETDCCIEVGQETVAVVGARIVFTSARGEGLYFQKNC